MSDWSREDVSTLKGVGPRLREKLQRLGIHNKRQMLFHLPLRYEDRTRLTALGSIQNGQRLLFHLPADPLAPGPLGGLLDRCALAVSELYPVPPFTDW